MLYELDGQRPDVADECFVAPGAHLIGKVRLKAAASVWFGATLRGDNEWIEIGARSNVQENCVFHTDPGFPLTIGEDCTIGHGVILHGCTIGNGALIGMGAIVLNGAVIGKGALVGAGALVTEGKHFADNSLIVGSPARAVRVLDAQDAARLKLGAAHYAARGAHYKTNLIPLA